MTIQNLTKYISTTEKFKPKYDIPFIGFFPLNFPLDKINIIE